MENRKRGGRSVTFRVVRRPGQKQSPYRVSGIGKQCGSRVAARVAAVALEELANHSKGEFTFEVGTARS
jgi:hypothetical protein